MPLIVTATLVSGACITVASPAMAGGPPSDRAATEGGHLATSPQMAHPNEADADAMWVGGRAKFPDSHGREGLAKAFQKGSQLAGPWDITRTFHRTLPVRERPITPDGVVEITSYKTTQRHLASFVKSMRPQDMIAWWHEPEGPRDGWPPGAYRSHFVKEYKAAHAANPQVKFGQISGGYQWRAGKRGADGGYLPPKGSVDWLGFDTYRTGTDNRFNAILPLSQTDEFQRWYAKAKTYDVPLYITEYGRGVVGVPGAAAKRAAVIPQDYAYLQAHGFAGFIVWYSNEGPSSKTWRFTDERSLAAWSAISRAE